MPAQLGAGVIQRLGQSRVSMTESLGPPVGSPGLAPHSLRSGMGIVQAEVTISPVTSLCLS